jgi:precorrin-6A synthase
VRTISVVGIGSGNPDHMTMQAINELRTTDVVFMMDKGENARELAGVRKDILDRYLTQPCRIVTAADPRRDRTAAAYTAAVEDWRAQRAGIYERLISTELGDDGRGAFLAWGDPAIYDSTLPVLAEVLARGTVRFDVRVIPGISSVQALAAQHQISLTRTGSPLHITTGRRLAGEGFPENADDVVVMLDGRAAFAAADGDDEIYWGAYLGTPDEILISGRVADVAERIVSEREAARERHGWIMDTYLLRRSASAGGSASADGSASAGGSVSSGGPG